MPSSRSGTGPVVRTGSWRVWPSSNGIVTPPRARRQAGDRVRREARLALLAIRDDRGSGRLEAVGACRARRRRTGLSSASGEIVPAAAAAMPSMSAWGRGMLPMGSVGSVMRGMLLNRAAAIDRGGARGTAAAVAAAYWRRFHPMDRRRRAWHARKNAWARAGGSDRRRPAGCPRHPRGDAPDAGSRHRTCAASPTSCSSTTSRARRSAVPSARCSRPPSRPRTIASTAWIPTARSRPRCWSGPARPTWCPSSTRSSWIVRWTRPQDARPAPHVAHRPAVEPLDLTADDVAAAAAAGATDADVQLAVLIAAAFSMYNRMVDGFRGADGAEHRGLSRARRRDRRVGLQRAARIGPAELTGKASPKRRGTTRRPLMCRRP